MGERVPARRAGQAGGRRLDDRAALPDRRACWRRPGSRAAPAGTTTPTSAGSGSSPACRARATRWPASPTCSHSGSRAAASTRSSGSRPSSMRCSATSTPSTLDPAELLDRFPAGAMTPDLMQRAASLGLAEPTDDGRLRVADRRFLDTGAALAHLGIPARRRPRRVGGAGRPHRRGRRPVRRPVRALPRPGRLAERARLRRGAVRSPARWPGSRPARQVLVAALDASVARVGRERLGELVAS